MSEEDLTESDCRTHGLDRHVCVHEAGHAVAAVDNGVDFRAVVFYDVVDAPTFWDGLGLAPAAVDLGPDPTSWVQPDPLGSFLFVLGGVAAEHAVLGDSIRKGWDEDIRVWRRGADKTSQQTEEGLAEYIGKPMSEAWEDATDWADANVDRISAVAVALERHEPPWELSREDVIAILDSL